MIEQYKIIVTACNTSGNSFGLLQFYIPLSSCKILEYIHSSQTLALERCNGFPPDGRRHRAGRGHQVLRLPRQALFLRIHRGAPPRFPGCDYNHWLIVMEFPKDPAPTREQMIDTYLNTLATVLGSMEEAKKNMYAFSTTTYTGFQCTVDEETSEKFKGLPGVLWVLPDSYIDVKNKDYGGDKYINGEIIPCTYPTYQPKERRTSKYESRRYERRRDGPPASRRPKQQATQPESASS